MYPACLERIAAHALLRYFTGFMEYYEIEEGCNLHSEETSRLRGGKKKQLVNNVEKCHRFLFNLYLEPPHPERELLLFMVKTPRTTT